MGTFPDADFNDDRMSTYSTVYSELSPNQVMGVEGRTIVQCYVMESNDPPIIDIRSMLLENDQKTNKSYGGQIIKLVLCGPKLSSQYIFARYIFTKNHFFAYFLYARRTEILGVTP